MPRYGISHEAGALKRAMVYHPRRELELANSNPVAHHFDQSMETKRFISDHQELIEALEGGASRSSRSTGRR
jgi:arginine deiminase